MLSKQRRALFLKGGYGRSMAKRGDRESFPSRSLSRFRTWRFLHISSLPDQQQIILTSCLGSNNRPQCPLSKMAPLLFTFRLILYTTILLLVSFLAVFIGLVATLLGKRLNTNFYVARTFCTVGGFIMGWRFEVEGEEHLWSMKDVGGDPSVEGRAGETGRSAVMVGNHQR